MTRLIVMVSAFTLSLQSAHCGQDSWVNARYGDIMFISNERPKRLKKLLSEVHLFTQYTTKALQIDSPKEQWPLRVFVCNDEHSFRALAPRDKKYTSHVNGYFVEGMAYDLIVMRSDTGKQQSKEVLFHELTHRIVTPMGEIPLWLDEGFAECFAAFRLKKETIQFGRHQREHLRWINRKGLLPLKRLIRVHHSSPEYNEAALTSAFYSTSWILTHYCLFAKPEKYRESLEGYVRSVRDQFATEAIFEEHFGLSFEQMEKELVAYARKFSLPKSHAFAFEKSETELPIRFETLSQGELEILNAGALVLAEREEDAQKILAQSKSPQSRFRLHQYSKTLTRIDPLTERIQLSYYRQEFEAAQHSAEAAFRLGDRSPIVLLVFSEKLLQIVPGQSIGTGIEIPLEDVNRAFFCINKLLKLDSGNQHTARLYALAWLRSSVGPNSNQVANLHAHSKKHPNDYDLALITYDVFTRWNLWKEAGILLATFIENSDSEKDRMSASQHLQEIREMTGLKLGGI